MTTERTTPITTISELSSNTSEREALYLSSEASEYEFTSECIDAAEFCPAILCRLESAGLIDTRQRLALTLVFQEALANAIEHGNLELRSAWREELDEGGCDKFSKLKRERLADERYSQRVVRARISYTPGRLEFVVTDEGKGFKPKMLSGLPKDALQQSGRGLALIGHTMDEVRFDQGGRSIIMVKLIGKAAE